MRYMVYVDLPLMQMMQRQPIQRTADIVDQSNNSFWLFRGFGGALASHKECIRESQ